MVLALYITYLLLDRVIQAIVVVERADLDRPVLVFAALTHRWWLVLPLAVVAVGAAVARPDRALVAWSAVDHGRTLRLLALPLIAYLMWKGSLYPYNFVADQAHALDRLLVVVLGALALYRPLLLVPFLLHYRILGEQTLFPFATAAVQNVDEFMVVALLGIAAGYLVAALRGAHVKTSPVLLLLGTVVAAHFYIPGKAKLAIGWMAGTDLANLPLGSHTAGWLGNTDGGWARWLSGVFDTFSPAIIAITLLLEVGAVIAVLHPRLLRWWIPGWLGFHVMTFAATGFFFLGWAALEVGLLVVLTRPRFREWVAENATPARGIVAALAVLGAPVLFHPPGLAWLDAPISYGYELEAVGESGRAYHVPLSTLAPLDHEMTFSRLQLGPTVPLSGGYGSLSAVAAMSRLDPLSTFAEVEALEAAQPPTTLVAESQQFLLAFFDRANDSRRLGWLYRLGPPSHFWSQREGPGYRFDEPIDVLEVYHLTSLHGAGSPQIRRELVLRIKREADGGGAVATP